MPGEPIQLWIPRKGKLKTVKPRTEADLVRLRTELELLSQCAAGASDKLAQALEHKISDFESLCELSEILRDACDPAVAAAIKQCDTDFPHVRDKVEYDVVRQEAARIRKDLARHVRTSATSDADELADAYANTGAHLPSEAAEPPTELSEIAMTDQTIEDALQNVELNVAALHELVEQSDEDTSQTAEAAFDAPDDEAAAPTDPVDEALNAAAEITEDIADPAPQAVVEQPETTELVSEAEPVDDTLADSEKPSAESAEPIEQVAAEAAPADIENDQPEASAPSEDLIDCSEEALAEPSADAADQELPEDVAPAEVATDCAEQAPADANGQNVAENLPEAVVPTEEPAGSAEEAATDPTAQAIAENAPVEIAEDQAEALAPADDDATDPTTEAAAEDTTSEIVEDQPDTIALLEDPTDLVQPAAADPLADAIAEEAVPDQTPEPEAIAAIGDSTSVEDNAPVIPDAETTIDDDAGPIEVTVVAPEPVTETSPPSLAAIQPDLPPGIHSIQAGLEQAATFLVTEVSRLMTEACAARDEAARFRAESAEAHQKIARLCAEVQNLREEAAEAAGLAQQARIEAQTARDEAQQARNRAASKADDAEIAADKAISESRAAQAHTQRVRCPA